MKKDKKFTRFAMILILIGVLLLLWLIMGLYCFGYINFSAPLSISNIGNIGCFISGIGIFFSLAGVILIYETLNQQRTELNNNRKNNNIENLEKIFFNLMSINNDIRKSILYTRKDKQYKGVELFKLIELEFKGIYKYIKSEEESAEEKKAREVFGYSEPFEDKFGKIKKIPKSNKNETLYELSCIKEAYGIIFNHYHNYIGHYFRNLYHILKFLSMKNLQFCIEEEADSIKVDGVPSNYYLISADIGTFADYVQSQMTSSELFLLFYNAIFFEKTKVYVEQFEFLENLVIEDLVNPIHCEFYKFKLKRRADIVGQEYF